MKSHGTLHANLFQGAKEIKKAEHAKTFPKNH